MVVVVEAANDLMSTERDQRQRLEALLDSVDAIVWEASPDASTFWYVSQEAERILGYPVERWREPNFWVDHLYPDDRERALSDCLTAIERGQDHRIEYRMVAADGRVVHMDDLVTVETDQAHRPVRLRGVMIDVTQRRADERRVTRLADIVEHIELGLVIAEVDGQGAVTIKAANPEVCRMTNRDGQALIGASIDALPVNTVQPLSLQLRRVSETGGGFDLIGRGRPVDDREPRYLSLHAFPLPDESVGLSIRDVTDVYRSADALRYQATHDPLTGLPNRTLLADRLQQAVAHARRGNGRVALLMMDLDQFKEINDTLGHDHGDRLLAAVADRLGDQLRESDTVARLGGDEFAILLTTNVTVDGTAEVAERVVNALETPFEVGGLELHSRPSIGIAVFPDHADDPDELLKRADVAMYVAKRSGRGYALYRPDEDRTSVHRLALLSDLRRAVEHDQFELHYQPVIDLRERRVVAVEALLRWHHPDGGVVPPDEFLEAARVSGLVVPITWLVMDRALGDVATLPDNHRQDLGVAVNLSARNLSDPLFAERVEAMLAAAGFPPSRLTVEVTETEVMDDPHRAVSVLGQLRELGVQVSLDDFGTGHSSISHLKDLPIDELKIDRSFVAGLRSNPADAAIVKAIVDLGHNLGLRVVGEGVEDAATLDFVTSAGCDRVQGFYLSCPLPPPMLRWMMASG
ncbi:MAG: putative bifunctional diguanylate cyclase/phosphodiesterase [Acidimicrobiales bacterium]